MRRRLRKGGDSINSFMAWVGGKKALRDEILARFPRNYKRYIEVFGGAGWVLFHKPPGNDFEVFNDFNGNLVNLYRCVREQPEALRNELRYMLNSRLDFEYMPYRSYKDRNGDMKYSDTVFAMNETSRNAINDAVLAAYEQRLHMEQDEAPDVEESIDESPGMVHSM